MPRNPAFVDPTASREHSGRTLLPAGPVIAFKVSLMVRHGTRRSSDMDTTLVLGDAC